MRATKAALKISPHLLHADASTLGCCCMSAQHSAAQQSRAEHSTAEQEHSTAQQSAAQHSTAQHRTAQCSKAQHSEAQRSTAQHVQCCYSHSIHSSHADIVWPRHPSFLTPKKLGQILTKSSQRGSHAEMEKVKIGDSSAGKLAVV